MNRHAERPATRVRVLRRRDLFKKMPDALTELKPVATNGLSRLLKRLAFYWSCARKKPKPSNSPGEKSPMG
ncbi:MAG: hypothetical protein WC340_18295 [Kiritimatiellia bacterium]